MDANLAYHFQDPPTSAGNVIADTRSCLALQEMSDVCEAFEQIWDGDATASLVPRALGEDYCSEVFDRFIASPARIGRVDGVPGDEVGATQYGKSPQDYMALADHSSAAVKTIMGGPGSELQVTLRNLAKRLASRGVLMRPLIFEGEAAPMARFARWTTTKADGRWLLRPHEDWEQTRGYRDWEISGIDKVIAINAYIRSRPGSGQLVVTSWKPSDEDRNSRGLQGTGYPYPDEDLLHRPFVTLPVATGDIAIIDGAHLHGVLIGEGDVEQRLIANLFLGRLGDTAVFWA